MMIKSNYSLRIFCALWSILLIARVDAQSLLETDFQSLLDSGQSLYLAERFPEAETLLRQAVDQNDRSAAAHFWLGMALYEQEKDDDALEHFVRASRLEKNWAMGHFGIGLVYLRKPNRKMDARKVLRTAAKLAPDNAPIQYYLGMTFVSKNTRDKIIGAEMDGRAYFQSAVSLDPRHPDAYYQLGLSSEHPLQQYDRAIFFYFKQLSVTPDHYDALTRLGMASFIQQRYQEALEMIDQLVAMHGEQKAGMFETLRAQMAASHFHAKQEYAAADGEYLIYLGLLNDQERAYYSDLQYIASQEDYQTYLQANKDEKKEIERAFWAARDPNPATVVNERLVEHYRRIMFSRTHFSAGKSPWDRRGEIYIRYGDPDDLQRFVGGSNEADMFMKATRPNQSSIRELGRRRGNLGSDASIMAPVRAGATETEHDFIMPTQKPEVDAIREFNREFRYRLRARGAHATESWVFVPFNLEMFFVDQRGNGIYDYPDIMMDPTALISLTGSARQERFHPETIADLLVAKTPEEYEHDFGGEPLQFVFDTVTYRTDDRKTEVELTYSIPTWQFGSVQDGQGLRTWLDSHVALRDKALQPVVAHAERIGPIERPVSPQTQRKNNIRLHTMAVSFTAPPGEYETGVELQDQASRRIGVFKRWSLVADYSGDSLLISDLKLSTAIEPDDGTGKFVRNGLSIAPNPGRLYQRGQLVYVYYEIYNLKGDDVGDTRYDTIYEITPKGAVLRDRSRTQTGENDPILLMFEDTGTKPDEARFTSLDTTELPAGEYALTMTLADRTSGQSVSKATSFVVVGPGD